MFGGGNRNNMTSLNIINKIAPHWNIITVKSSMNSKSDALRNIKNDINTDVNTALDIFLGNYNAIDNINVGSECSLIQRKAARKALLLYPDKFKSLNKDQQQNLLTFLAKYRSTFNKLCVDSAISVFKNIEQSERNYNYDRLNKELVNTFHNDNIADNINGSLVSLFNSYNRSIKNNKDMLMTDKILWCCSYYLPLVNRLSETIKENKNNETLYKQFYNKNSLMNIFPIMENNQQNIIKGGNTQQINNMKPIIKTEYVYIGGDSVNNNNEERAKPKTSTTEYIEELINGQIAFNKSFEQIYKDLIKSLYSITLTEKQTTQSTSLNGCLYALKGIEINSPKTSYKISGYYSAKNWNKYYVSTCYKTVDVLAKNGMGLFDETIKCVKDLINLCESSAKKANELINKYISSVKISSETFSNVKNVSKIASKLSYQELNRYGENIKRLEQSFASISNQSSIYSTSQLLDSFLSKVQDRNDLIREYFRNKETQLKLNGSTGFNNDRVEMLLQFNNQIKQCMIYLNQTVDTRLAEYRKQKNDNMSDDKLFAKFEKAMIMFKDLSNNANLRNVLEKLSIVLNGVDFEGNRQEDKQKKYGLDLIKIIQRFWKESGYIDFIIQLYTELNIFPSGFNWSEFRDNITLLLSIVNITVSTDYSVKISAFNQTDNTNYDEGVINNDKHNIAIKDSTSIQNAVNIIVELINLYYPMATNNQTIKNILNSYVFNGIQQMFNYATTSDKLVGKIQPIRVDIGGVEKSIEFEISLYDKRFMMALTDKNDNDNGELRLTKMLFDAMLVNVLDVINNYTSVKYTGNFKLPIQLSNIIKGGDKNILMVEDDNGKKYGGNVFDILSVNDNNYDGVIVDATPFYISAFNILLFYYQKYNIKRIGDNVSTPSLFFYVPKISPLYPIYKKIESYNIDSTAKLNANLIKTGIGVFNNYWRRAEGATPAEKLSNAIDILLNEVNACMVYSSKLQFDALQITGKLSNNFLQNLSSNIQNLSKSLIEAINEAVVDMSMSSLQQTELFETIMKNDLNKVRQKANSEEEKLAMVIDILTKSDDRKDVSNEIYKFIDFAIMPMLETLVAYNNVFKTYDLYIVDNANVEEQTIDLTKIMFIRKSSDGNKNGQRITYINWLNDINNSPNRDLELTLLREQLQTSSIVNAWNTIILANHIDNCIKNKNYTEPTLWQPNIYDSWPRGNNLKVSRIRSPSLMNKNSSDIMLTLYQLYPYINGKTIWDYFEATLTEFTSDIDHCLHLMMSYPNINDKFIKAINSQVHKIVDDDQDILNRVGIGDGVKQHLINIKMEHELGYVKPPAYKPNYFVSQYNGDKSLLQQMVVYNAGEYVPTYIGATQKFIPIDGYNQSVLIQKFANITNNTAEYSWTDWVIQKLAECDSSFACVPYKFIEALRTNAAIAYRCQPINFDSAAAASIQPLPETPRGKYVNPVTANIIARSITDKNIEKTDDNSKINAQWIANLIGIIPYMVNKLKAYYNNVGSNVDYEGVNVKTELNILLSILSTFYNDIVSYCPRVGFMENLAIFDNNKQYHAIAEIIPHLQKYNFENSTSSLFSKYVWANRYFFGTNADMLFPESKDYDRFEKLKQFGGNVFNNAVFANEFDTVITILGKILIMSSIATSMNTNINNDNDSYLFKVMAKAMYYSAELVPNIHYRLMDNVLHAIINDNDTIAKYTDDKATPATVDNVETVNIFNDLKGIMKEAKTNNKNYVIGQIGDNTLSNETIINKFKNGLLTKNDIDNNESVYRLYRMLKFQNDKTNNINIPAEASHEFIDGLYNMSLLFWLWLSTAASVKYDANNNPLKIHDYIKAPDHYINRVMIHDYKNCTPQTVYTISTLFIIHWLSNVCQIFDLSKPVATTDNNINLINNISKSIYIYGDNDNDKYLQDINAIFNRDLNNNGDNRNFLNTIGNMIYIYNTRSTNKINNYRAQLLSSLMIFTKTNYTVLNRFIEYFDIDPTIATALNDIYKYFQNNDVIDLVFTYRGGRTQTLDPAQNIDQQKIFIQNIDQGNNRDIENYRVTRDANNERIITVSILSDDLIIDRDKLANNGLYVGDYNITINNCQDYIINPTGAQTITRIGINYHVGGNNFNSVFDNAHAFGGALIDYMGNYNINNNIVVPLMPFNNIISKLLNNNQYKRITPIYTIGRGDIPEHQRFVGGASPNRLYTMLLSGIIDINRANNLPFQINKEISLEEAVKNVCYLLNTIPEYKICGVVNPNVYTPETSINNNVNDKNINIISYLKNRNRFGLNASINDLIYNNVYIFPPNHNEPTPQTLTISQDEIDYIADQNIYKSQAFNELNNIINNLSRLIGFAPNGQTANGYTKIKLNRINNRQTIINLVANLIGLYSYIGADQQNNTIYRLLRINDSSITDDYILSLDPNNLCSCDQPGGAINPLYTLLTSVNYDNGITILAPYNFNIILMYFISSIFNNNVSGMRNENIIKIALYATLLSQSLAIETLNNIIRLNNYNKIETILINLLALVYVKSLSNENRTIFKGSNTNNNYVLSSHCFNLAQIPNDTPYITPNDYNDKFVEYQINKSSLLITKIQQPRVGVDNIVYSDIDSLTAIYNFINPTAGLVNASAAILNTIENTNNYAIIGQPYNCVYSGENETNNIIEHMIGSYNNLKINHNHILNMNTTYERFNIFNDGHKLFDDTVYNNWPNYHNTITDLQTNYIITGTPLNSNHMKTLIEFINSYTSMYIYAYLLRLISFSFINNGNIVANVRNTMIGNNDVLLFFDNVLLNQSPDNNDLNNTLNNHLIINRNLCLYDSEYNLYNSLKTINFNYESIPYYNNKQSTIDKDITAIRLFDTCRGILNNVKNVLITTLNKTVNTGFAHNMFTGGVAVDDIRNINMLVNSFITNSDFVGSYYSPTETYKAIYNIDTAHDSLGKQVYNQLFKYTPIETMKTEFMFALIINYFHKYTVSFNSIYNSVIFPSVIYGSAVFNTIANKYKETFDKVNVAARNDFTQFIHKYLTDDASTNFEHYYNYDDTTHKDDRNTNTKTYTDLINIIGNNMFDISKMISINDKLLNIFNKYKFTGHDGNDIFMKSSLLGTLKRIDAVETFTFIILLVTKYMSYYNVDTDEDISYTGQVGPNPLGYNIIV